MRYDEKHDLATWADYSALTVGALISLSERNNICTHA